MNTKILSVSIASYNTEAFLYETVQSLLTDKETLSRIEIIIVNDGSTDNTSAMAHSLEEKYPDSIKVIDKQNGGYGSTINASLSVAQGKYYKLLDGDDWYNTEALNSFINYLGKTDSDLVITPYLEVRNKTKLIDNHTSLFGQKTNIENAEWDNNPVLMHEIAVRTEVLKNANIRIAEKCFYTDLEFAFYCTFYSNTVSRFEKPIYKYRLGVEGQSVSLNGIRKHYSDLPVVAERIFKCYTGDHLDLVLENKKNLLDIFIKNATYQTYRAFMLLEHPVGYKKELIEFDHSIKAKYPVVYSIGMKSKLVRTVRLLHFHGYRLFCQIVLRQYS